jgi:hypothetical protein
MVERFRQKLKDRLMNPIHGLKVAIVDDCTIMLDFIDVTREERSKIFRGNRVLGHSLIDLNLLVEI